MADKRLKLSDYKGMNVSMFVHASDETTEMINLKPTGNGLEMRNGGREILSEELDSLHGENNAVFLTDSGRAVKYDYGDGVSYIHPTFKLIDSGYSPVESDKVFETNIKDLYLYTRDEGKLSAKSEALALYEDLIVLFDNETDDNDQSLSVWKYNPVLKSVIGGGLCNRADYPSMSELDHHVLVEPVNVTATQANNNSEIYDVETVTCRDGLYRVIYDDDYYRCPKKVERICGPDPSDTVTVHGEGFETEFDRFLFYADGQYLKCYKNDSEPASVDVGDTVEKVIVFQHSPLNTFHVFVSIFGQIRLYYYHEIMGVGGAFEYVGACAYAGKDFDAYLLDDAACGTDQFDNLVYYVIVLRNNGVHDEVKLYRFNGLSSGYENATECGTIYDSPESDLTGVACKRYQYYTDDAEKMWGYFVLYNSVNMLLLKFDHRTDIGNDKVTVNIEIMDSVNYRMFPFISGEIKNVAISSRTRSLPVNAHQPVAYRPFFGIDTGTTDTAELAEASGTVSTDGTDKTQINGSSSAFPSDFRVGDYIVNHAQSEAREITAIVSDTVLTVRSPFDTDLSAEPVYIGKSEDLYNIPILENYEIPLDLDNPTKFNPIAEGNTRWLHWLFYVLPAPIIDTSVNYVKLVKGYYDKGGMYQVRAWGTESSGIAGEFIEKYFSNYWSAGSVILRNVARGNEIVHIDRDYTWKFEAWGDDTDIVSYADGDEYVMKVTVNTAGDEGAITKETYPLKYGKQYVLRFWAKTVSGTVADCVKSNLKTHNKPVV